MNLTILSVMLITGTSVFGQITPVQVSNQFKKPGNSLVIKNDLFKKDDLKKIDLNSTQSNRPLKDAKGGQEGSGGDAFTADFLQVALHELYPWITKNGQNLVPAVTPMALTQAIDPTRIVSVDHVYESCDSSQSGREVDACYNRNEDLTYLSRSRYPLQAQVYTKDKCGFKCILVAHEIFRRMKIETDAYEVTKQIGALENVAAKPVNPVATALQQEFRSAAIPTVKNLRVGKNWECRYVSAVPGNMITASMGNNAIQSFNGLFDMGNATSNGTIYNNNDGHYDSLFDGALTSKGFSGSYALETSLEFAQKHNLPYKFLSNNWVADQYFIFTTYFFRIAKDGSLIGEVLYHYTHEPEKGALASVSEPESKVMAYIACTSQP